MSKTKKIIPELRFPEFKNEGEWEEDMVYNLVFTITPPKKITSSNYQKYGKFPIIDQSKNYYCGWTNDNEAVITEDLPLIIFGDHTCVIKIAKKPFAQGADGIKILKTKDKIFPEYLFHYLCHNEVVMEDYKRHYSILKDKVIVFPNINSGEQQRIASCLSSLDEVIEAHSKKLELLKDHKKGLLQNLFPQEGETVPKVRFPEFEEDGEWELKPFSKFIKLYRGSSPRPIREYLTKEETGVNWIKIGDTSSITDFVIRSVSEKITPKGAEKSRRVKKGELILANSMSYGSTYLLEVEGCIYDGWFVLREYEEHFDKQFLLQLLNSEYTQGQYKRFAAGGIVQNISSEIVYSITLSKTSKEEQQKIASCLSAVDELITAQQDKIEQLQQHKKGLMQGLFPSADEVAYE